jgi:hypothetical protein
MLTFCSTLPTISVSVMDALAEAHPRESAASAADATEPRIGPNSFDLLKVIGRGGYGKVCVIFALFS